MTKTPGDNWHRIVKFTQELLLDEEDSAAITPALISNKIDVVVSMKPAWGKGLDRTSVIDELIRRFSQWMGQDTALISKVGHQTWLDTARKRDWRYWQRYREWLEETLSWRAVDSLDRSTDNVLGFLEDPVRDEPWDRRGLVVGHVQSGKTAHYTGLICKAADAGYKIIVVLAGTYNNLRSQTQIRLDEGFLGFSTSPNPDSHQLIGAGRNGRDAGIRPNCATNRDEAGDFNRKAAKHLAITPEQRPWLFVVKKNKNVLELLLSWIRNHAANSVDPESHRPVVTHLPLLVIDDEADNASVDTGEQLFNADGTPNEDHQPKRINSLIRKLLNSFSRSAYVGYTATPFANIFIHEKGATREEGPDLFPSAFIVNLGAPSNYIGPAQLFGVATPNGHQGGLPLVRDIRDQSDDEHSNWMPAKHKNGHQPRHNGKDQLPPSLVDAIDAFILTCVARSLRGQASNHSTMLLHVTRFNSVQDEVRRQVDEHLLHLRQRVLRQINHEEILRRLKTLWENDFLPTTKMVQAERPDDTTENLPPWEVIQPEIAEIVSGIEIATINGSAKDALRYSERQGKGLKVIVIGGEKLSRGLTLYGLCVSYFLRASKMYDTLMQMGRWFGYRPGYLDLCRLYTTNELLEWFRHIADASEELREEFDLMASTSEATPKDYGLKVLSHPVLMITSPLKMRTSKKLMLSFSGQLLETVSLYRHPRELIENLTAVQRLITAMGRPSEIDPSRKRDLRSDNWKGFLWEDIPDSTIVDFLLAYKTHPSAYKVNSSMLADFIHTMTQDKELTQWTVAIFGGGTGDKHTLAPGITISMNKRSGNKQLYDRYSIGRLLNPKDEAIDLNGAEWAEAMRMTRAAWKADPARLHEVTPPDIPSGPAIRRLRGFGSCDIQRHPERGVLMIYVLDPAKADIGFPADTPPIAAFAISFPGSDAGKQVEYKVNNVLWEQEYGPAE
jgi:hypothetical protein